MEWQISPAHILAVLLVDAVWLLMLVGIAVLVAYVIVRVLRSTWKGPEPGSPPRDAAMEVLRERYARGEIDAAEFEERRRLLGG
jgi:putative membrane protein